MCIISDHVLFTIYSKQVVPPLTSLERLARQL
jgi:hypothetical protein